MHRRYYLIYVPGAEAEIFATPLPEAAGLRLPEPVRGGPVWVGDRSFPHWLAADLIRQAKAAVAGLPPRRDHRRPLRAAIAGRLRRWGRSPEFAWEPLSCAPGRPRPWREAILAGLEGRILSAAELRLVLRGKVQAEDLEAILAELALLGAVEAMPAVEVLHLDREVCHRCGETRIDRMDCWFCGERDCWICPTCGRFGPATGCGTLYARPKAAVPRAGRPSEPILDFALTPAQAKAAEALRAFLRCGEGEFLLWAVCGAGKTEVVLSALAEAFARGDRVLLATPRRDVAADLALRARAAFPDLSFAVHHGGRHEEESPAPDLTVATTHQCLRFYRAFDLVVLDEVDAFPYHGNEMLYFAVSRAGRPGGRTVYVTATPPMEIEKRASSGSLSHVRLPVRHHGHPLPVPELIRSPLGRPAPGWRVPAPLEGILAEAVAGGRRSLVFVPTVQAAGVVGRELARWGSERGLRIAWLHAADPAREEKRRLFAEGGLDVLVATTVLERGLTLGPLDVCVLFADCEAVFDAAALIQMAGRAGRLASDPAGRVHFLAERIGAAMKAAHAAIVATNDEAAREGFLYEK
ncbi:MAG: DEAD/DEAH box helicase [Firmicutes bacterium]|nr:DEAD/DEAH box helicase [Bacillota bacterium]